MSFLKQFASGLRSLFRKRQAEQEMDEELRGYLDAAVKDKMRSGSSREEALRAARVEMGSVDAVKEEIRSAGWESALETLWQDIRFGARQLKRNPGFTAIAVLTLALGIGANTAIFSVIESVMFQPLPFPDSDQIARIYSTKDGSLLGGPSPMDTLDLAQSNHTFQELVVYDTWRKNVSYADVASEPEQMAVGLVPAAYFRVLGMKPIMGRLFTEDESRVGKAYVAAISAALWRKRFGGDKAILGRKIWINDEPYRIVAVMPDEIPVWMEFRAVQIWTPFPFADSLGDIWTEAGRGGRGWSVIGRMKPGISLEQAHADLSTIAAELADAHPVDRGIGVEVRSLAETRAHDLRSMLFLLMGAVTMILLIACVNLANLLLARNSAREGEMAMRSALGARRGRLVAQLLSETLLLSLIGAGVGLFLARIGVESLARMHPDNLPQLSSLGIDWRVLVFTLFVSLVTSLLFGLGPALAGTRLNLVESLKQGSRSGTAGSNSRRMRSALVAMEMALSLMLLVGAGLLLQSTMRLERQSLGIRQEHLLTGHFFLPGTRYPHPEELTRFSDRFAESIRALPGVEEASITTIYPPNYNWSQMLEIPGHPAARIQDIPRARFGLTDAHFLRTLGVPLIRGRDFTDSDSATSPPVALISQELVRRYFPQQDPIGLQIHIGPPDFLHIPPGANTTDSEDVTIIGIIGDFRNNGLALPPEPQIIVLYAQHPLVNYGFKDIVIRTASDPHLLVPEITRRLHAMDADMPFAQVRTIDEIVEQETGSQRFTTLLLGLFAASGLVLAAVGIYGVVSFLVSRRQRELAIRVAVGASAAHVLWLVLKDGLSMAAIGATMGLVGVWAGQKLLAGLLFEISPVDPLTFVGAAVFLFAVVLIACWVPAWGAARVDPCTALRAE